MKKIICVLFLMMTLVEVKAQSNNKYYLIPQVALLNGDYAASAQVQLVGGIEKKKWSYGIGAAIDYYKVRTIPVFADLRVGLNKTNSIAAYLNMGTNIAWPMENQYTENGLWWNTRKSSFSNGLYADMGLCYRIEGKKKNRFLVGIGYTLKTITETVPETIFRDFPPYIAETTIRSYKYTFNRLALRVGFRL